MHIGLDLDNTIIDYGTAFAAVGQRSGLLPTDCAFDSKAQIKRYLTERSDNETDWMRLQGMVYGPEIASARLYDGFQPFLDWAVRAGHSLSIVSHKSERGHFDETGTDLRDAARAFLYRHGVLDTVGGVYESQDAPISAECVYFEPTRDEKVARIAQIACDVFIDDLREVLEHPAFPEGVVGLWFAPGSATGYSNWWELRQAVETCAPR